MGKCILRQFISLVVNITIIIMILLQLVASKRGHETKKHVLKGARHDMFCRQTLNFLKFDSR